MSLKNKLFFFTAFFGIIINTCAVYGQDKHILPAEGQELTEPKPASYNSRGRRDPFYPLVSSDGRVIEAELPGANGERLQLEGIIYDPKGDSYAVINTEIVKVGDRIGYYEIIDIQPQKIVVIKDNEKIEIGLGREE